jgi:hypothetical protein
MCILFFVFDLHHYDITPSINITSIDMKSHPRTTLTPKALQWPNFGHFYFGHVAVIKICDMIF